MKPIALACTITMFALAAAAPSLAQSLPKMPTMPSATMPSTNMPSASSLTAPSAGTSTAPSAGSLTGGQSSNSIANAKTTLECKLPTNAAKPECIKQMLVK